jgi:hypothetical protein
MMLLSSGTVQVTLAAAGNISQPSINQFPSSSGAHELDDSNRRLAAESPSQPRDRGYGRLADNEQELLQQFSLK